MAEKTVARVGMHNGVPVLFINEAPYPAYICFFRVPNPEHLADFANAGIHLYTCGMGTVIGDCMDMGWVGPGLYDYTRFDEQMQETIAIDPQALIFPRLAVSAPKWWLQAHPDDRILYEDGRLLENTSMASATWLAEAGEALRWLIRHVQDTPYGAHIIGYQLTGGANEWFYAYPDGAPDFSPAAISAFRGWLRRHYADDVVRLREAWKTEEVTFADALPPSMAQRLATHVNLFRDPSASRQVSDYFTFFSDINTDALLHLSAVGKEATNRENIFGAFYGYLLNAAEGSTEHSAVNWGHQALRKVLASPDIDFLCAPYRYILRGAGGYDAPQSLIETVKLSGKLFIEECDHTTFLAKPIFPSKPVPSRAETMAILKRDFSNRLIRRVGMWWMDQMPNGGWYHDPEIVRFLKRAGVLWQKSSALNMRYQGEVAVIMDEETPFHMKPCTQLTYPLIYLQDLLGFSRMGATYDFYLHNDLANPAMPEYPLYIFLNTFYLTAAEREVIKQNVQRDGKTAVWMFAPGFIEEQGLSIDTMRELTGITLNYQPAGPSPDGFPIRIAITDFDHPSTRALPGDTSFGTDKYIGPFFYSEDPEARVLGRLFSSHFSTDLPAFVTKTFPDWTSVFVGAPNLPPALLRGLASTAGCHLYGDEHDITYANSHYLAIHTSKAGPRHLRLPRRTHVYDAFTEALIARDATEFTDNLGQYETKLYFLGDIAAIADAETRLDG